LLAACLFAASVTSCVSDGLTEPGNDVVGKEIATLAEQASSVMTTISDVKALKETADGHEAELNGAIRSLESHVSYLSSGSSWEDATLATLAEQKKLAAVVGPILAQADAASATKTTLNSLDANAKAWLGKNMGAYWSAVSASAKSEAQLASYGKKLSMWKLQIEGIASDIEAGLKEGVDLAETDALLASVSAVVKASEDLNARLSALASDVEEGYQQAIATASEDPESFDAATLKSLNKAAAADLQDAGVTMNDLIDLVAACESEVTAMQERVGILEDKVEDLEQLLDLIQSVNLMQDNSSDYAVAYYTLDPNNFTDEGYMKRIPQETIDLRYLIRPASAAEALVEPSLWNAGLNVFGYYAQTITKAGVETFDLNVTNVALDANVPGLVTVTVDNAFDSEDFYFKKTGAKVALSIVSGKTDLTSKFVEIVPKDESNTVYAESLTVTESIELEFDESAVIKAVLNPLGADQSIEWESDNVDVVTVSSEGVLTTKGVGTANVTATSVTTDEYGRKLSAICNVTVNPDIKIVGPKFVEEGYIINLRLDCPRNINPDQITWTVSNPSAITVQKTIVDGMNCAVVTGNAVAYNGGYEDITITCKIAGEPTLTHTVQCVEVQPRDIDITGLTVEEDEDNEITLKFGQSRTLDASILPNTVDDGKFTLAYGHSGEGFTRSNQTITAQDENTLKNGKVTGYFNVEVNSDWYWYDKTFQTIADKITRNIKVNVDPYYVTSFTLPSSADVTEGQSSYLDVTFVSDDPEGVEPPSYTELEWNSSDPSVVSVDENGRLTSYTTGSATITARIKYPDKAIKPGYVVADATCSITVLEPGADEPSIGAYYYDDGTWSTERDTDKTVIGIIFSLESAGDGEFGDPALIGQYSHGLVVSTMQFSANYGSSANPFYDPNYNASNDTLYELIDNTYSGANFDHTKYNGYSSTEALKDWRSKNSNGFDAVVSVLNDNNLPDAPDGTSGWYIPSYKELLLLYNSKGSVNQAIGSVAGTQILESKYWSSSLYRNKNVNGLRIYYESRATPFNMDEGTMLDSSGYGEVYSVYPVRVILAF